MLVRNIVSYMKELKEAGVPDQQASIHAEKLAEFMENNLSSKEDLKNTEQKLSTEIKNVEQRLSTEIKNVEQRLGAEIKNVEQRLGAEIKNVEQKLEAKIGNIDTKLDWLIRLIGVIAFVLSLLNFLHWHIPAIHV